MYFVRRTAGCRIRTASSGKATDGGCIVKGEECIAGRSKVPYGRCPRALANPTLRLGGTAQKQFGKGGWSERGL